MGKNQLWKDVAAGIGGFGEGFVKTLQAERKRKDEEKQFNQEMSYKTRQQDLMSTYYQALEKNMELDNQLARDKFNAVEPEPPKKFSKLEDLYGGKLEVQYQEGQEEPIGYGSLFRPEKVTGGSSSGGGKNPEDISGDKLTNKYEIDAFSNLRNSGTGKENEEYTPQMRDRDFKIVGNALLSPNLFTMVEGLRKGTGDYPTVDEIIDTFKSANLQGKDKKNAENFIRYYSQIESTLAPTKVQWWAK